jgi:CRISPR type III-A-associated RAMP protein Csm4
MNPGLVVKLRPSGPWRIGSDSGARNRVDTIYHSDSLYSAVSSAMARLGSLEDWLDATARAAAPAVCFSSCFPFLDEIGFIVPPRIIWPPAAAGISARVRWKSARFVPLEVVRALLAGRKLDETQWSLDGTSECLAPAGRPGPFRTSVRWSAAVDRLTGATERHSTACIEFRAGCGLWTVVSFLDDAARERWQAPVKAAFRLLADSGFGGERSRGWGRSEPPEFIEGDLPDMILLPAPAPETAGLTAEDRLDRLVEAYSDTGIDSSAEPGAGTSTSVATAAVSAIATNALLESALGPAGIEAEAASSESSPEASSSVAVLEMEEAPEVLVESEPEEPAPEPAIAVAVVEGSQSHWLLSLYTPAPGDTVDWRRGSYAVLTRGGRVESPAGSGGLKRQVQMIAEGSVLAAASEPRGSAADVGPDGFPHPVYRAGFAVSIPLPEVR